jgi:DNA-binding MarR family transcriptional regulator
MDARFELVAEWIEEQGPIGRLVKHAHISLRRELEERLRETGLTHAQWSALTVIRWHGGISPSELEHILLVERPSVTSLINGMEKRGLVIRKARPDDARYRQLFLTPEGERLADETASFTREIESRIREAMGERDFAELRRLLRTMIAVFAP